MKEPSIYTKIMRGEVQDQIIYEDNRVIAILTTHPLCDGHTLVIPKKQIEHIWDLEPDDYNYLWKIAQKIALHLRTVLKVDRVGVVVKGFSVLHTHIHLIPVNRHSGIIFDPYPKSPAADSAKLAAVAESVRL